MMLRTLKKKERDEILGFLEERFGFKRGVFAGFEFLANPKGRVFIVGKGIPELAAGEKVACMSMPFVRLGKAVKPTSVMIQTFGKHAKRNVIELDRDEAKEFMEGSDLSVRDASCSEGYVILRYRDYPLGCGLLKDGKIKNMLPKAKRMPVELL